MKFYDTLLFFRLFNGIQSNYIVTLCTLSSISAQGGAKLVRIRRLE